MNKPYQLPREFAEKYKLPSIYIKVDLFRKLKFGSVLEFEKIGYLGDDFIKAKITCIHSSIGAN